MWWALDNTTILGTQLLSPTPIIDTKSTHCIALDHLQPPIILTSLFSRLDILPENQCLGLIVSEPLMVEIIALSPER